MDPTSTQTSPLALITGASQGLGWHLAEALVDCGWRLVVTARTESDLTRAADTLRHRSRGADSDPDVVAVPGDVADPDHRRAVVAQVERLTAGTGLAFLVNNASTLGPTPLRVLADLTPTELAAVLDTNVVAPHALTCSLLPALVRAGGAVLNVSSDAGVEHYETWGGYGASKAALDHLTLTLAAEHPDLRAWSVDPGDMRTAMHQAAFPGEDISDRPLPADRAVPGILALLDERPPSGRYRAQDLARANAGVAS